MATEGYCVYCGAEMYRDSNGKLHSRNPEPGCPCALPTHFSRRWTVDREADTDTWFLWDGTPEDGEVIATGDLSHILKEMEVRA